MLFPCFLTFTSKACLKSADNVFAKASDLPVSVAYNIVHLILFSKAFLIRSVENFTTLVKKITKKIKFSHIAISLIDFLLTSELLFFFQE